MNSFNSSTETEIFSRNPNPWNIITFEDVDTWHANIEQIEKDYWNGVKNKYGKVQSK